MSAENPLGRFVWYDLMTTDVEAAIAFYKEVAGWGTQLFEQIDPPYTMWTVGETPIGGVVPLPPRAAEAGAPPHWLSYVSTPDVDETLSRATELGGSTIHPGQDIPGVGRFGVLSDPQGAALAVYTSTTSAGDEAPPELGHFSWHELTTSDHEAAFEFHSQLFGWEKTDAIDMGEMGIYQMYGRNGVPAGGMFNKPPGMPGPDAYWLYYFLVDDCDSAVERIKAHGGQILNGPMEVPDGDQVAQCIDPQGGAFAIHARKSE